MCFVFSSTCMLSLHLLFEKKALWYAVSKGLVVTWYSLSLAVFMTKCMERSTVWKGLLNKMLHTACKEIWEYISKVIIVSNGSKISVHFSKTVAIRFKTDIIRDKKCYYIVRLHNVITNFLRRYMNMYLFLWGYELKTHTFYYTHTQ